jgi:hypothetical protein
VNAKKCEGMNPHTPKWTPCWELESQLAWRFYEQKKGLPFGHLKHKLWSKERLGVRLAVWLPTIKSWESTQFPGVQVECDIPLKRSWRGLQLCFRPHHNRRSVHEVMGPQGCGNLGHSESCEFELLVARPNTKSVPTMH